MTPNDFCIWLHGYLDGSGATLSAHKVAQIKASLKMTVTWPEEETEELPRLPNCPREFKAKGW